MKRSRWWRRLMVAVLIVLVGYAGWEVTQAPRGGSSTRPGDAPAAESRARSVLDDPGRAPVAGAMLDGRGGHPEPPRRRDDGARALLRRQILARHSPRAVGDPTESPAGAVAFPTESPAGAFAADPTEGSDASSPGALTNRMGPEQGALVAELNRDFMPLAQECIDQARERNGALSGTVEMQMVLLADEELGAVIESASVEVAPRVQGWTTSDPELSECIGQTARSLLLPPPAVGGRTEFVVTMPLDDGGGSGAGSEGGR